MRILRIKILLISLFFILSFSKTALSYSVETHESINNVVAETTLRNGFTLNIYLKNQLDLANGVEEIFNNTKVLELLGIGGECQDKPPIGGNHSPEKLRSKRPQQMQTQ